LSFGQAYQLFTFELKAQNLAETTILFYDAILPSFFKWLEDAGIEDVASVQPVHVKMYLAHLRDRQLSDYYLRNTYNAINKLYNVLMAEELISASPMGKVTKPITSAEIRDAYSAAEIKKLLAACLNERDRAIIATLAGSGLRAFELLDLNWSDVNFDEASIRVKKGKWRAARKVYVSPRTMKALYRWRMTLDEPADADPVFTTLDGKGNRLSRSRLFKWMRWLCKKAKVEEKALHAFRRYYALESVKAGVPLPLLCRLMGIKHVHILIAHYLPFLDDDVKEAAGKVDVLKGIQ